MQLLSHISNRKINFEWFFVIFFFVHIYIYNIENKKEFSRDKIIVIYWDIFFGD